MNRTILVAAMALSAAPVFAQSNIDVELLLGQADQESSADGGSFSDSSTSYGLRGAYVLNDNVAFELGYQKYGEISESYIDEYGDTISDHIESEAFNAGVKGILPLQDGFSLHARLGIAFWDYSGYFTDSSVPDMEFSMDDSGNDFYFGVGGEYRINENIDVGLEYTVTNMDATIDRIGGFSVDAVDIDHEVQNIALTLGYRF